MRDTAPRLAPNKSTGIGAPGGPEATASRLAAKRATVNAECAAESEKSQDAIMGDLSMIDFQQTFQAAAAQLKIDLKSKSDHVPIPKLNDILKLMASGAMKEVEECTDLLAASMMTTATANNAAVTSLSTVEVWNEKERERLEDVIAQAKGNIDIHRCGSAVAQQNAMTTPMSNQ